MEEKEKLQGDGSGLRTRDAGRAGLHERREGLRESAEIAWPRSVIALRDERAPGPGNVVKLQCPAGQANPRRRSDPALGQHGVNIMEFCKTFNARTQDKAGMIIPAVITIYADRSFTFELKSPPAAVLLKKAAKIEKGSGEPNRRRSARSRSAQLAEIAEIKKEDLNAYDVDMPR